MWYCPNDDTGVQLSCPDSWIFFGAPGMARSAIAGAVQLLWWQLDDLEVQVLYTPVRGKC